MTDRLLSPDTMNDAATPYHHGQLRSELLKLAAHRIEETGVPGLSLRELARELGVSHGAPRRHFPDKQALLDALAVHGLQLLGRRLDADLDRCRDSGFDDRLMAFAQAYVDFATSHPVLLGLMFARKEKADSPELRVANERAFAAPRALIADAHVRGDIADQDHDRVAMAVLATLQGLAAVITGGMIGDRPPRTVVAGTIRTLVNGLRST
jgi:AcrR family transcriptional regulator